MKTLTYDVAKAAEQMRGRALEELSDRELDALVSHALFGTKPLTERQKARGELFNPPAYSSRIERAFEVVEAMRERGAFIYIANHSCTRITGGPEWRVERSGFGVRGKADGSLPRAICIAALRATDEASDLESDKWRYAIMTAKGD